MLQVQSKLVRTHRMVEERLCSEGDAPRRPLPQFGPALRRRELLLPLCRVRRPRAISQVDSMSQPDSGCVQSLSTITACLCGTRDLLQLPHSFGSPALILGQAIPHLNLQGVEEDVGEGSQSSSPCTAGRIIARRGASPAPTVAGSSGRRLCVRSCGCFR